MLLINNNASNEITLLMRKQETIKTFESGVTIYWLLIDNLSMMIKIWIDNHNWLIGSINKLFPSLLHC